MFDFDCPLQRSDCIVIKHIIIIIIITVLPNDRDNGWKVYVKFGGIIQIDEYNKSTKREE